MYRDKQQHQFTKPKLLELLHLIALTERGKKFVSHLFAVKNRERRNIKKFMEENFEKPLDVEDYAYLTGRSVSTFRRDFMSRFGISPKKWLIDQRLAKASELLKKTSESISEIALKSGYEDTPHFIKAFQKKFETSPKQYQIKHRTSLEV
jgi:transcriptional regulator GlxA family with amidase domain